MLGCAGRQRVLTVYCQHCQEKPPSIPPSWMPLHDVAITTTAIIHNVIDVVPTPDAMAWRGKDVAECRGWRRCSHEQGACAFSHLLDDIPAGQMLRFYHSPTVATEDPDIKYQMVCKRQTTIMWLCTRYKIACQSLMLHSSVTARLHT